jgi:acetylornithine/succinyldiaminopimelate/putrescine aminotransferase
MVREYGVRPSLLVVGKGFSGGEYAASRILFDARMDSLPQVVALVTNGQEELASLAYLITMRWAEANAEATRAVGEYYFSRLQDLARDYRRHVAAVQGCRHLAALCCHGLEDAKAFASRLVAGGVDISVQTYKAACPPAALTKLPLIAGSDAVDMLVSRMDAALRGLDSKTEDQGR